MNSVGDAFGLPFRSPNWFGTIVLQGLILIIPIIGQISLLGWLLITLDNLRAGRQELAPAGFHLRRGIALFGVELIYGVVLFLVPSVLQGIGSAMAGQNNSAGGAVLVTISVLLQVAASLLLAFLTPVLIMRTSELGFSGGMDVGAVWRQATADVGQTVVAALLIWVAEIIGGLGLVLCFVGVLLTTVYANGVIAGIVSWYERTQGVSSPSTAV
jgi:Protein of unknown function (DUF4013)